MKLKCPVCHHDVEVSYLAFRIRCQHCKKELEIMTPWLFETIEWTILLLLLSILIQNNMYVQKVILFIVLLIIYLLFEAMEKKLVQMHQADLIEIKANMKATLSQIQYVRYPVMIMLIDTYLLIILSVLLPHIWIYQFSLTNWFLIPLAGISISITYFLHVCLQMLLKKIGWIREIKRMEK